MDKDIKLYFDIIRYSIEPGYVISPDSIIIDWHDFYRFLQEQAMLGVVFDGINRLSEKGLNLPSEVFVKWLSSYWACVSLNRLLNKRTIEVVREYQNAGFLCCVLKGQGNALMYPNPECRAPGDIDLFVLDSEKKVRKRVFKYVRNHHPNRMELRYYHTSYYDNGVEVEVHFLPNIINNPFYNRRLQKWYKDRVFDQCHNLVELPEGGAIPIPTASFNVVFQLAHMMHHFFDEGIGLRQMTDYFFVLKMWQENGGKGDDIESTLKHLGLFKFAGAVMYTMKEVFGMEESYMLVAVDERRGGSLMREILRGGNFGKSSGITRYPKAVKYLVKTWNNILRLSEYPEEALFEPFFRTWHFFWRVFHRLISY